MDDLKNKSVLVIGWEYPPRMVGGLAFATHGIVKALSKFIHVKLIIPYKDKETPIDDNITVYGLNTIAEDLNTPEINYLMHNLVYFKSAEATSVYPFATEHLHNKLSRNDINLNSISYLNLFKSEEVYGWDLWEKMNAFKEVVATISQYLTFDIIHCHDWITFSAGRAVKQLTNKPLVLHIHALETDRISANIQNDIYNIELKTMQLADIIFPVSSYTKKCIIKHYGIQEEKLIPIHNAIEDDLIKRWRHNIPQKIVTFLGRITSQKGPGFLLETIQKVVSVYKNVRFVIAGSGDLLESLMMQGAYEKLSKYTIFTGFIKRDEVNALLATSDVYFMPSVSEPFGLTAIEAARAGVACVITKQSGAAEVLLSALKADFWDTDKFAKQIVELLQDDKKRSSVVNKQWKELTKISWNTSAEKIISEYYKLLN